MYAEQPAAGATSTEEPKKEDGPVDAEYKEVKEDK
jgi:hypothetical protein